MARIRRGCNASAAPVVARTTPSEGCKLQLEPDTSVPSGCFTSSYGAVKSAYSDVVWDLDIDAFRGKLASFGPPENEVVYAYVVRSIGLNDGVLLQTGCGANFDGGVITLATCKHAMRATLTSRAWRGKWIAGFTSWTEEFHRHQYLVYLMRVGEAYDSHFDLVEGFRSTGRGAVVDAKDSTKTELGDLILPNSNCLNPGDKWAVSGYTPPRIGHVHRQTRQESTWHEDVSYSDRYGRRPALLVGDAFWSFAWQAPLVCRAVPGRMRGHRRWTMTELLYQLEQMRP